MRLESCGTQGGILAFTLCRETVDLWQGLCKFTVAISSDFEMKNASSSQLCFDWQNGVPFCPVFSVPLREDR